MNNYLVSFSLKWPIFTAGAVLLLCIGVAPPSSASDGDKPESRPSLMFQSYGSEARALFEASSHERLEFQLSKAIHEGRVKPEEFEKLDFTMPDEPGFGDNVEYEVFNPASTRTVMASEKHLLPLLPQEQIDAATTVPGTRPFFNLRRETSEKHGIVDRIVMIVPNIDLGKCGLRGQAGWSLPVIQLGYQPQFHPNLSTVAIDQNRFYGAACYQTPDNKGYLSFPLVKRNKPPGSENWKFYYNYITPNASAEDGK